MRRFILLAPVVASVCTACALPHQVAPVFEPNGEPTSQGSSREQHATKTVFVTTAVPADNATRADVDTPMVEPGTTVNPNAQRITKCPGDPNSPEITRNIPNVPPPQNPEYRGWMYLGDSNYDTCSDLSYASLMPKSSESTEFPMQLMLFHKGEYIGVGALAPGQHVVIATDHRSVTVRYKDWEAYYDSGDPNAHSENFTTDVTYVWSNDHVQAVGRIPNQNM